MNNDIDQILEKYWNGESNLQEEAVLKSYFASNDVAKEHETIQPLFNHMSDSKKDTSNLDVNSLLTNISNIDLLIEKYWKAESSTEDERTIKAYFNSDSVDPEHAYMAPLFEFYKSSKNVTLDKDLSSLLEESTSIDALLEKYWKAETSLEEEEQLRHYFASDSVASNHLEAKSLFVYYGEKSQATSALDIEEILINEAKKSANHVTDSSKPARSAKVISFKKLSTAIAAIFVLGFAAITVMDQSEKSTIQYQGKFVHLDEESEAQEAYEITKEALAYLSKNMKSSSNTVTESVAKVEKVSIFK